MILDNSTIIEEFVHTFHGLVVVQSTQGKHLLVTSNRAWEVLIGAVVISMSTALNYCSCCDNKTFLQNQKTYRFLSMSIRKDMPAILVLGNLYH